ncbi:hypothetical protein AC1031_008885 [Aphanomyces cochlioides]|nr:hypothetical protein AC1031_008885 [Aphanomyces cochlioides]
MALCSKDNLRAGVRTSGAIELLLGLVLLIMGCSLASSYHYHIALGPQVGHASGGLIFIALLYPIPAWFASYAAKYHNKFMLLVHGLLLIGLVVMQLMIGGAMYGTSTPTFAYDFASMCLVNVNLANATTLAQCRAYFESEEYARLALAWQTYYNESLVSESAGHAVTEIEDANVCCGLGPPELCQADTRPFPSDLPTTDATQRQFCAALKTGYYPPTPLCSKGASCPYDSPIGSCGLTGVARGSSGCARHFHAHFASTLATLASLVMIMTLLPIAFVLVSVCFLFKRKDEDVLPTDLAFGPRGRAKVYVAADIRRLERAL